MFLRCTRCGQGYTATCPDEKHDPTRMCARCYVDTHQPPLELYQSPTALDSIHRAASPAAHAAGAFTKE